MPKRWTIVEEITRRIVAGELAPGERIPTTVALMAEFEVSYMTVVGALDILRERGLIVGRRGSGRFVAPGPSGSGLDTPPSTVA